MGATALLGPSFARWFKEQKNTCSVVCFICVCFDLKAPNLCLLEEDQGQENKNLKKKQEEKINVYKRA